MLKVPEQFRFREGILKSDERDGNNGCFIIPYQNFEMQVIASDGEGWEHISVSMRHRCPNWNEMCFVKSLFWDEEDCVVQYHPPKSEYVNNMEYCLHLWRPVGKEILRPPSILVGFKDEL